MGAADLDGVGKGCAGGIEHALVLLSDFGGMFAMGLLNSFDIGVLIQED